LNVEYQTPVPVIEIFLPSNSNNEPDLIFTPNSEEEVLKKLLGYSFTESVDDLDGSFSFTVETGIINNKTIFDTIKKRSVIKIYEGTEFPVFIGIIRRRRLTKQMTGQGIKRSIVFSGKSITSCVSEYMVSLDVKLYKVTDAVSKNQELIEKLSEVTTIADFIKITWDYFNEVSLKLNENLNGVTNTKIMEVIDKFLGKDFVTVGGFNKNIRYNIATVFFNEANNHIADVWRNILPKDVYEMYSYCDKESKIMVRMVPFGDPEASENDWNKLELYPINPLSLTAYDLDQNDENVYTAFVSYIVGSAMSREFYQHINTTGADDRVRYDPEKVAIYGFRPLEINFMGYDREGNSEGNKNDSTIEAIKKINDLAKYWYSRNDDMYSGSITLCTNFNEPEKNPKVGCRAKFLGGEFYINKTEHTWHYLSTPTIKLTLSRGMVYENGVMKAGEDGVIQNVGEQFEEFELLKAA
jgi:hypothetical protein